MSAGICDITGAFSLAGIENYGTPSFSGCFYHAGLGPNTGKGGGQRNIIVGMQASRSNALYGKSRTVTPLSRKCLFLIKY